MIAQSKWISTTPLFESNQNIDNAHDTHHILIYDNTTYKKTHNTTSIGAFTTHVYKNRNYFTTARLRNVAPRIRPTTTPKHPINNRKNFDGRSRAWWLCHGRTGVDNNRKHRLSIVLCKPGFIAPFYCPYEQTLKRTQNGIAAVRTNERTPIIYNEASIIYPVLFLHGGYVTDCSVKENA